MDFEKEINRLYRLVSDTDRRALKHDAELSELPKRWQMAIDNLRSGIDESNKAIEALSRRTKRELDCFDSRWEGLSRVHDDTLAQNTKLKERATMLEFENARLKDERDSIREIGNSRDFLAMQYKNLTDELRKKNTGLEDEVKRLSRLVYGDE